MNQQSFLSIENDYTFTQIGITGLRFDCGSVSVHHRASMIPISATGIETNCFRLKLAVCDHSVGITKLLSWFVDVQEASDLLLNGESRSVRRTITLSPDGHLVLEMANAVPRAFYFASISEGHAGMFEMEFAYESISRKRGVPHVMPSAKGIDKLNDQKLVCELSIQARHARRQELVVEAVSDFGARIDFEFMTLKHQSTKLFKCGDEQTSSIRCAIQLDQHRSQLKQLIDLFERSSNMLISDRPDAVLTIKKSISGESLLQFKLSSVMIRSIDADGASTADQSASYVVELQPRSIRSMVSGTLSEYAESDLPWENFSLEQVEEPAKSLDSSMNMSKQRLLRLSPNFPANSGGIALHPLVFAKVGESSSEIDSTTKKRILGFHQQLGVNEVFDRPQSRRLKVEFYLFPSLLSPLVSSSELSFTAMLDSLVLFLVYGRDSMIAGSGISVAPLDPSQYTAGMISGSYRSFLVYDVEPFRNFAMNVEDASYLVDRFDRRGRPSRARFQIEGLLFNSLS